jgi:phage pi2 protein 07
MTQTLKTMILTLLRISKYIFVSLVFCLVLWAQSAAAQTSQSISVSPTLFDMSAEPGKLWMSNIRVVNSNPYELTVYAEVVNFMPQGESGQSRFIPIEEAETEGQTLAEWFTIKEPSVTIPAEQTATIPFVIDVPEDAVPGGHFAALLIGTMPPEDRVEHSRVETSQVVTSLVFLRVAGDINESGRIRSFRTTKRLLESSEATFELRFENTGNVHLQPQGEITITNMWGQQRGVIPVNQGTMFGNVLPDSIRRYQYTWTGEWSLADVGRYTAEATLAYGQEGRQFSSSKTYFWVVPWRIALGVLAGVAVFLSFFVWAIKAYIRRMLVLAGVAPGVKRVQLPRRSRVRAVSVAAPFEEGMLDLRQRMDNADSLGQRVAVVGRFVASYWFFFSVMTMLAVALWLIFWYVGAASTDERAYQVTVDGPTGPGESLSSDEIEYRAMNTELLQSLTSQSDGETGSTTGLIPLRVVNQSGVNGLGAKLRVELEFIGYDVGDLSTELNANKENTVIVYAPEYADEALLLSREIPNALLSAYAGAAETKYPITIYVGRNLENELQL